MKGTIVCIFMFLMLIPLALVFSGGCADEKKICLETPKGEKCAVFQPVGIFEDKDPRIEYKISVGNVVLSVIFSETALVPLILCGWYLWEPVRQKI